jgi:regulator of sigma E protease
VNGVKVTKWRTFLSEVSQSPAGQPLKLTVEHGNFDPVPPKTSVVADVSIETTAAAGLNGVPALAALGVEFPELYLAEIVKNSPAAKAGLEKGDRVLSINGQAVTSFDQIAGMIRSFGTHKDAPATAAATAKDSGPNPLEILVDRNGEQKKVSVVPNVRSHMSQHGREESQFEIGIHPMIIEAAPQTFKWSTTSPVVALERGISQTLKWSGLTVLSFVRLFQGKVSAKNIGGFLSIGQVAKTSWQVGPAQFLMAMAFISINLFVLNLLPVPVLDGGHLVFYSIELIKGAPLSMRKMEIAQQVGLALLLGLMVFALFNDVSRLIGNG